jgi:hypothetical protein
METTQAACKQDASKGVIYPRELLSGSTNPFESGSNPDSDPDPNTDCTSCKHDASKGVIYLREILYIH